MHSLGAQQKKYINLSHMPTCLENDPDLAGFSAEALLQILQTLYVVTGCDYVSFFKGIGKQTFLKQFFRYADFITGGNLPGSLADTDPTLRDRSFFAFARLVGATYFQKHSTCFAHTSPEAYYHSFDAQEQPAEQQHVAWLDGIRESIWIRISEPSDFMPSTEALRLHWYRSVWILHMWNQASASQVTLLPMPKYGWKANGDYMWETEYNIQQVQARVHFLTRGCGCATKACETKQCGCNKSHLKCGPGQ